MTTQMEQYLEATQRVSEQLEILAEEEQAKRRALLERDMDGLSDIMRHQQAQVMKLEGFEKKRLLAQRDAGFEAMTGTQILQQLEGADRTQAETCFTRLREATQQLHELNQVAMEIADSELKMIDRILRTSTDDANGLYTSGGKKGTGRGPGAAFEEKI